MTTVNGQDAEPGCYIAGHHGQYGPDMLGDVCEQFDIEVPRDDDPRVWRFHAESDDPDDIVHERTGTLGTRSLSPDDCWERHTWAADKLEEVLNEHTTGGYWSWEDGEFFLTQTEANGRVYVIADDYEEAWEYLRDGVEGAIYADRYQACELADDCGEDVKVYEFQATFFYIPDGMEGIDPREGVKP